MRFTRNQIAVAVVVAAIVAIAAYQQFVRHRRPVDLTWGEPVNGLRAAIEFDSDDNIFGLGQYVKFHYKIKNTGRHPVRLDSYNPRFSDNLIFHGSFRDRIKLFQRRSYPISGYSIPQKAFPGKQIRNGFQFPSLRAQVIQPGETLQIDDAGVFFVDDPDWAYAANKEAWGAGGCVIQPGIYTISADLEFLGPTSAGTEVPEDARSLAPFRGKLTTGYTDICIVPSIGDISADYAAASFEDFGPAHSDTQFGKPPNGPIYGPGPPRSVQYSSSFRAGYSVPRFIHMASDFRAGLFNVKVVRFSSDFSGHVSMRDIDSLSEMDWRTVRNYEPPGQIRIGGRPKRSPPLYIGQRSDDSRELVVPAGQEVRLDLGRGQQQARQTVWQRMLGRIGIQTAGSPRYPASAGFGQLKRIDPTVIAAIDCHDAFVRNDDLRNLRYVHNLKELDLSQTSISDEGLKYLRNATSLKILHLPKRASGKGLKHLRGLKNLETLIFAPETDVRRSTTEQLAGMKSLRALVFTGSYIRNDALKPIGKLTSLEHLMLDSTPIGDKGIAYLKNLKSLKILNLDWTGAGDDGLQAVRNMKSLVGLYLAGTNVTDAGTSNLAALRKLQALNFHKTTVGDETLRCLAGLKDLWFLELSDTQVTDDGLIHLSNLRKLSDVNLLQSKVSGEGLEYLYGCKLRRFPIFAGGLSDKNLERFLELVNVQELRLENTQVTDDGLAALTGNSNLCKVVLPRKITDEGLAHLKDMPNLRELDLYNAQVMGEGLAQLKGLPNLETLDLSNSTIDDEGLRYLGSLKNLRTLRLSSALNIQGPGLRYLSRVRKLGYLRLDGTNIDDAALEHLYDCKYLARLSVGRTRVTQAGMNAFKMKMPNCDINNY